jgi:hypothetical protein
VFADSVSATFVQVVNQVATTTVVTSNANPSVVGQNVTFTARVTPAAAVGTIQFTVDGIPSTPAAPDATGRLRLVVNTLTAGPHTITAAFVGSSPNYGPSTSAAFTQTVNKASSRTVVATSGSPAARGTNVTFTATVTATGQGAGLGTGNVAFSINGSVRATVALDSSGVATYTTAALAVGLHPVVAVYAGDANVNGSTSNNINQRIR